jgi:hypothetical protein
VELKMPRATISLEEAIKEAEKKILPAGYKPEDYFCVGEEFPLRIAQMLVKEVKHIIYMDKNYGRSKR